MTTRLDNGRRVWKDMGYFMTGFLIVSGLALPVALFVAEIVRCPVARGAL